MAILIVGSTDSLFASSARVKLSAIGVIPQRNSSIPFTRNRYKMHWSEGHIWRGWLQMSQLPNEFSYKYAIQDPGAVIKKWEPGPNRKFDLTMVEEFLCSPQNAYSVQMTNAYKFEIGSMQFVYNKEKEHLAVIDNWQN